MSPTPVTFTSPTAPAAYTWEATNEAVAERYGIPVERIARFDLNTSPAPPDLARRVLAAGRFDVEISEYPPSDYRRLVLAAAARYGVPTDDLLVGAGADEILDIIAKAFIPSGGRVVIPIPTYAMYRVLTEQRGAIVVPVARRPASDGYALDVPAIRAAARGADLVWLCDPNNPTGLPEPDGAVADLLAGLAADAAADGVVPPVAVLDEAYAEFVGRSLVGLRAVYPRLVGIRTLSKAYALAGLRVGFAVARPEMIEAMAPYRPPGSLAVASVGVATDVLADESLPGAHVTVLAQERARLATGLATAGWTVGPSVTNFLLVRFRDAATAAAAAEGLLSRGLVPRTFGAGHPLLDHLRITVRDEAQDDRLIEAAGELGMEGIR